MDWLLQNWQTVAALAVVALTVTIFAVRLARPQKNSGCGGGCGCQTNEGAGFPPSRRRAAKAEPPGPPGL